jgi:hypothetical protein
MLLLLLKIECIIFNNKYQNIINVNEKLIEEMLNEN